MNSPKTAPSKTRSAPPPATGGKPSPQTEQTGRWMDRLRLLPVLMLVATLTFGVKVGNIWTDADAFIAGIPAAFAEDEVVDEAPVETLADEPGNSAGTVENDPQEAVRSDEPWDTSEPYSRGELQLLENLADRRAELEKRAREIDMRERVLDAMEQRIDGKIAEMKKIEAQVQSYLTAYEETHIENMQSLVKMYESMKPKDAARIFEQLQMDVLLEVAGNMKERQMASILAQMSPDAAKALTMELATKKPIPLTAN